MLVLSLPFSLVYVEKVFILGLNTCRPPLVAIHRLPERSQHNALIWSSISVLVLLLSLFAEYIVVPPACMRVSPFSGDPTHRLPSLVVVIALTFRLANGPE